MATHLESLRSGPATSHSRWLDGASLRLIIGIGGVLVLLVLAALPGNPPEAGGDAVLRAPVSALNPGEAPLDGRGKWTGYTP